MQRVLVHIPRPDQSFHVGFALIIAYLHSLRGYRVDILICNDTFAYCPVKRLFGNKMHYGDCSECDSSIQHILFSITRFNDSLGTDNPVQPILTSNYLPSFQPEPASFHIELAEFQQSYKKTLSDYSPVDRPRSFVWLSELCTMQSCTALDIADGLFDTELALGLISLAQRTKSIANKFLQANSYQKYIVYNGRHTSSKSFWYHLRKLSPSTSCFIHEIGLLQDSFSILNGVSNEDHFELTPVEYFPNGYNFPILNSFVTSNSSTSEFSSFLNYITPRFSGQKSYYASTVNIATSSAGSCQHITKHQKVLILLSSYDEVSIAYPVDRVLYEQSVIPAFVKHLTSSGYEVHMRLHPRSRTQLDKSKIYNGSYSRFLAELYTISTNSLVHIYEPISKVSSYQLMAECNLVISLFSIAAIEAQSLGCFSLVHERCRGSNVASGRIQGFTIAEALTSLQVWLKAVSSDYYRKSHKYQAKSHARHYLTNSLQEFTYTLPGFINFSPYISDMWLTALRNAEQSPEYYYSYELERIFNKLEEPSNNFGFI